MLTCRRHSGTRAEHRRFQAQESGEHGLGHHCMYVPSSQCCADEGKCSMRVSYCGRVGTSRVLPECEVGYKREMGGEESGKA